MSKLNLAEILKDCPKGTKLYSPIFGDVEFCCVRDTGRAVMIEVMVFPNTPKTFYTDGRYNTYYSDSEVTLFPSKDNRDWSTFKVEKPKFDISSLQPFDKVLVRDGEDDDWQADFFSHISDFQSIHSNEVQNRFFCVSGHWGQCVPHNDETKRLIGTSNSAPEFYVTWAK